MALIDEHRTRARPDDEYARAEILDLQRRRNALEEDLALLQVLDGHVFARQTSGVQADEFILLVRDGHRVR